MFEYDDSINLAFDAKVAGKSLVAAKHELLTKTGEFLFLAHSDKELALRMQMIEPDIEKIAFHKLSNVSDSKAKLVRAVYDEWQLRHGSCEICKIAADENTHDHKKDLPRVDPNRLKNPKEDNQGDQHIHPHGGPHQPESDGDKQKDWGKNPNQKPVTPNKDDNNKPHAPRGCPTCGK